MAKKIPSLAALVNAIVAHHGFSVHLVPLAVETVKAASEPAPAAAPATTLAQRTAKIEDDSMAPHGRDKAGNPLAPFGWLADHSRPRKTAAGRPASAATPAAKAPKVPPAPAGGFSLDLSDFGGAAPAPVQATPEPTAASVLDELEMDLGGL